MADILKSLWLMPTLRGILAVLLGIVLFAYPGVSLVLMLTFFGAFVMVSGIVTLIVAFMRRRYDLIWRSYVTDGIVNLVIGLIVFLWPAMTSLVLVYIIATWALITGIVQLVNAISLREFFPKLWLSVIMSVLLIVFALAIFIHPGAGA
ncbi:MAG: DUF308 domain-containing protein, partial [Gammaproteobacteria bacterium]|nr:DUF308 domain-containing protein [Gammaproteobacteria bacterium]